MTNRNSVRITPADVGQRVTVRTRIPAEPGQPRHTDVVGHLRSWADGVLEIVKRDGSVVRVAEGDLAAGRVVAPRPR